MEQGSVISDERLQVAAVRHARLALVRTVQSVTPIALIIALNGASGMPAHRERSEMARRLRAGAYVAKILGQEQLCKAIETLDILAAQCIALNRKQAA